VAGPTRPLPSLTWRLFAGIGLPVAAIVVVIGLLGFRAATGEINEVYDSQLAISAQSLLTAARNQGSAASVSGAPPPAADGGEEGGIDEYARWHSFRVWKDGRVVLASPNAPAGPPGPAGYRSVSAGNDTWRVYSLGQGGYTVETRENVKARGEEIDKILTSLILPMALLLPVIAAVLWFGIRLGLRGLRGFAAAVASRSPDDLSRIDSDVPGEMAPVVEAVNGLLERLEESLDQERAFTDNAAHELRTPLAVLKAQAEVVAGARNAAERSAAIAELELGVRRAARVLEQLLTLARLRHAPPQVTDIRLMDQAREAIKDVYPSAAPKGIALRLAGDEAATARTDPALLHLILRNVLDNAAKYGPADSAVDICVAEGQIIVRDRGPGVSAGEREKVFTRFYRAHDAVEPGSGLGLSIVRTAARQLGCAVELFTPRDGGGLGVRINFPD
jgi:signal transduction histidine kinase